MLHSNIYFSFNDLQSQGYASFSVQYYLPLLPQSIFIDSFSKIERTLLNVDPKQNRVITTHGFRSTFRDWSADKLITHVKFASMYLLISCQMKSKLLIYVEPILKSLMADWAEFCENKYTIKVMLLP